jgi:hypothetical protein
MNKKLNFIRYLVICFFILTVVFAALGAIGTVCVAWNAEQWDPFIAFIPYKIVFQILVFGNLVFAGVGSYITYALLKDKKRSYSWSLIILLIFLFTAIIQMYFSSTLRGTSFFSTPPTNIRFYLTLIIFILFILLKISKIWEKAKLSYKKEKSIMSSGIILVLVGTLFLSCPIWASPSHMIAGYNTINILLVPVNLVGWSFIFTGLIFLRIQIINIIHLSNKRLKKFIININQSKNIK